MVKDFLDRPLLLSKQRRTFYYLKSHFARVTTVSFAAVEILIEAFLLRRAWVLEPKNNKDDCS